MSHLPALSTSSSNPHGLSSSASTTDGRTVAVKQTFFRSMTFAVSASALVLARADESPWPAFATPLVAIFAYILVDCKKQIHLSLRGANTLGILAFLSMAWEFRGDTVLDQLLAGGHLLVYMSWIVLLLKKGIRQYWWLAAISVLQISVASILSDDSTFGLSVVAMLLVMVWLLSVFTLYRTQVRLVSNAALLRPKHSGESEAFDERAEDSLNESASAPLDRQLLRIRNGLQIDSDEPWIGWRFRGVVGFAFTISLVLAVVAFTLFPRVWALELSFGDSVVSGTGATVHRTGFTESVSLGETGTITPSDRRVLQFEITRMQNGSAATAEQFVEASNMDELLFRGSTLGRYERGNWHSSRGDVLQPFNTRESDADFRVEITQDPPIRDTAFVPLPATNAVNNDRHGTIQQHSMSLEMFHSTKDTRTWSDPLRYEVWCPDLSSVGQQHLPGHAATQNHMFVRPKGSRWRRRKRPFESWEQPRLDVIPPSIRDRYLGAAELPLLPGLMRVTKELGTNKGAQGMVDAAKHARRIVSYLSTNGDFKYSLVAEVQDQSIDPVEDFVLNRRTGHCEYFASACALMLQMADIPARIVSGYKGYEINTVTGKAEVKEKHAHTWVEAYLNGRWETLDPTPSAAQQEVTETRDFRDWWSDMRRACHDQWVNTVQKMSLERQGELLRPVAKLFKTAMSSVREQGLWTSIQLFVANVLMNPAKWFSIQGWLATFFVLLILTIGARSRVVRYLAARLRAATSWLRTVERRQHSVVKFYENFKKACEKSGFGLSDQHTAQENAQKVQTHFTSELKTQADQAIPARIAATFNQVKFGPDSVSAESVRNVRNDVSRFKELLAIAAEHRAERNQL